MSDPKPINDLTDRYRCVALMHGRTKCFNLDNPLTPPEYVAEYAFPPSLLHQGLHCTAVEGDHGSYMCDLIIWERRTSRDDLLNMDVT